MRARPHRASARSIHLARSQPNGTIPANANAGGVVEWLMAPVLKTGKAQAFVGSNPTPSAPVRCLANLERVVTQVGHDTLENRTRFDWRGRPAAAGRKGSNPPHRITLQS